MRSPRLNGYTSEENAVIHRLFETHVGCIPYAAIASALPNRSVNAVREHARHSLKLRVRPRPPKPPPVPKAPKAAKPVAPPKAKPERFGPARSVANRPAELRWLRDDEIPENSVVAIARRRRFSDVSGLIQRIAETRKGVRA